MEALMLGSAAAGSSAATAGLFGVGGSFSAMQTLMTVGTGLMAAGAVSQGQAQAANYQAQQQAADYNAAVLAQNASLERSVANQKEEAQRRDARRILGAQRAAFSQSGTGLGGSAADVMAQSAADAELDALTLRYEGDMRARGMMAQADAERYQGRVAGMNASNARTSGYMSGVGTILGGVARYADQNETLRYRHATLGRIG